MKVIQHKSCRERNRK